MHRKVTAVVVVIVTLVIVPSIEAGWSAGVARVNITPTDYIWMGGYAKRSEPARGKLTELWAKAVALDDGRAQRAVLITADLIGVDRQFGLGVRRRISEKLGLPLRSVALNVSHTHSGPVVGHVLAPQQLLTDRQRQLIDQYAEQLSDNLVRVATDATDRIAPCQLQWGTGTCGFAVNRRENDESAVPELKKQNRLQGPVDHSVPVLRVANTDGNTIAVIFGYACHATVTGENEWSADYPGFAQMALEQEIPGAVAMFWAGCGADQNPLPRRRIEYLRTYGNQLRDAVLEVLKSSMQTITGKLSTGYEEVNLAFGDGPSEREIRETLNHKTPKYVNWAQGILRRRAAGETMPSDYPYPVQLWKLGDGPFFVLLGGEVVVDYSLRLKSRLGNSTWVAGYSNDVMNYIPSRRVYLEGGYEGLTGMYSYGLHAPWTADVEKTIVAAVDQLAQESSDESAEGRVRVIPSAERPGIAAAVDSADQPLVHTALMLPLEKSGQVVAAGDTRRQTRFLVQQLEKVLEKSGSSLRQLIKINGYAASPEAVRVAESELAASLGDIVQPAATFVAGELPHEGVMIGLDVVAASSQVSAPLQSVTAHSEVYRLPGHSHSAVLPRGEKIYLSGWIHRGDDDLSTAVDETLVFQVQLLNRVGGTLDGVVQIRAFVNVQQQYDIVQQSVQRLFKSRSLPPPVVCAPWGREGPPEIELIAAGRTSDRIGNAPRVEYFNLPDRPASPVFSRAARVNSDRLIFVSGITSEATGDAEAQIREIFRRLRSTLRQTGSDLRHMVKATYWLADRDATAALGKVRREIYDPKRPPAASAFFAQSVGYEGRAANVEMIAVPHGP